MRQKVTPMRLRRYKLAFSISASLCLGFLGLWLYSLVGGFGVQHYSPRNSVSLASNDGRLWLRSNTVSIDGRVVGYFPSAAAARSQRREFPGHFLPGTRRNREGLCERGNQT